LTSAIITVDPHTGYPTAAEFVDFAQTFTTISFESVTSLPKYLFDIPPSCQHASLLPEEEEEVMPLPIIHVRS